MYYSAVVDECGQVVRLAYDLTDLELEALLDNHPEYKLTTLRLDEEEY